ncbi:MAG: CBS domain-containing protein [Planctomycetota bacterium]|nr:CBS domain-containing protein [Planctomycetota bacterium]
MLVRSAMSAPAESVDADDSCAAVWQRFQERRLRRAPIVDGRRVIGMVTDRDLFPVVARTVDELDEGAAHSSHHKPVRSLITRDLLGIAPNDHIEQAAQLLLRAKVGGLPVIDSSGASPKLVGILTESDIFRLFVRRTLTQRGHRLVLRSPARPAAELDPAAICVAAGARLFDLSLFPLEAGRTSAVLQLDTDDLDGLLERFRQAGYEPVLVEQN